MKKRRTATKIDQHVGARLRLRRQIADMSQGTLGERIGVSFQQVQKYERGTNRISAGLLLELATIFDEPVTYFYEGIDHDPSGDQTQIPDEVFAFLMTPTGVNLARDFVSIEDSQQRAALGRLVGSIAGRE